MTAGDSTKATIRCATAHDIDHIYELVVELAAASGMRHKVKSTPDDFLIHGFGERPAYQALIAELQGRVVGLSLFFFDFSTWLGKLGVYVQDLIVRDEARGSGLGRRLIKETVRLAQQQGATHLRLSVDARNERAMCFYRALGIEESGDERIFHAHGAAFRRLADES